MTLPGRIRLYGGAVRNIGLRAASRRAGKVWTDHCEINVVEHCNLSCRSCSHFSPIMPKRLIDPDVAYRDCADLSRVYHVHRVDLLGGEPLLHPDLPEVIRAVRRSGIGDTIGVVTNGTLLTRMGDEFWREIDDVRISVYPGYELSPEDMALCRAKARRHGARIITDDSPEFRESHSNLGTQDTELVRQIYATCTIAHRWACNVIADGYFYKCPLAYFLPRGLAAAGYDPLADAIKISTEPGFRDELQAYLDSPEPLQACRFCLGTVGKRFAHAQEARREWTLPQQHTTEELLDEELLAHSKRYVKV